MLEMVIKERKGVQHPILHDAKAGFEVPKPLRLPGIGIQSLSCTFSIVNLHMERRQSTQEWKAVIIVCAPKEREHESQPAVRYVPLAPSDRPYPPVGDPVMHQDGSK